MKSKVSIINMYVVCQHEQRKYSSPFVDGQEARVGVKSGDLLSILK